VAVMIAPFAARLRSLGLEYRARVVPGNPRRDASEPNL